MPLLEDMQLGASEIGILLSYAETGFWDETNERDLLFWIEYLGLAEARGYASAFRRVGINLRRNEQTREWYIDREGA